VEPKKSSEEVIKKVLAGYNERHSIQEVADKIGVKYPAMMRMLNEQDPYAFCVSKLISLIEATKDFTLLDEIELRLGRVANYVKPPEYDFNFQGFSRLVKESSEATRAISDAFADGRVSPQEATDCIKELRDLVSISLQLIQSMEIIEKDGKDYRLLRDGKQ
jgi:hypothetical protein